MRRVEDVWTGSDPVAATVRTALRPFEAAYAAVVLARNRLYDAGILRTREPALPTLSVGNLTVGGTGKTPVSAWFARALSREARTAVVLRGYGGDEVQVHRRLNPDIEVVVNADRLAAVRAARALGAEVVVLDDAFQHRRAARVGNVLLLSVEQLLRPQRRLPAGPWREGLPAASRADLVVLTRKSASADETARARRLVQAVAPDKPVAIVHLAPNALVAAPGAAMAAGAGAGSATMSLPLERLANASVFAIAAIGEPELFRRQLEALGARVTLAAFRDHHRFSEAEIRALALRVPLDGLVVCTLKDAVKLADRWPGPSRLWYVSQQLVVDEGADDMNRLLKRVLDARAAAAATAG